MIKTIKKFKVSPPSAKEEKLCKLVFDDIRIVEDFKAGKIIIHYVEYIVLEENVSKQVEKVDSQGNLVFDDNGDQIFVTVVEDVLQRNINGNKSKAVTFDIYNAIANQVKANLPTDIEETDEDRFIAEMGIKLYTVQEGYYEGITMVDYEN